MKRKIKFLKALKYSIFEFTIPIILFIIGLKLLTFILMSSFVTWLLVGLQRPDLIDEIVIITYIYSRYVIVFCIGMIIWLVYYIFKEVYKKCSIQKKE